MTMAGQQEARNGSSPGEECIRFVLPGFGNRWATGIASLRSCQKLSLCLIQTMPAGSKTGTWLGKAEPSLMVAVPLGYQGEEGEKVTAQRQNFCQRGEE